MHKIIQVRYWYWCNFKLAMKCFCQDLVQLSTCKYGLLSIKVHSILVHLSCPPTLSHHLERSAFTCGVPRLAACLTHSLPTGWNKPVGVSVHVGWTLWPLASWCLEVLGQVEQGGGGGWRLLSSFHVLSLDVMDWWIGFYVNQYIS